MKWPWISSMKHQDLKFLEYHCSNTFTLTCAYIIPVYAYIVFILYIYILCIIIAIYHECTWNASVKLVQMKDSWVIAAIYYGKQLMYPCTCYKTIDSSLCNLGTIPIEIDLPLNFSPYFSLKKSRTFPYFSLLLSYNL